MNTRKRLMAASLGLAGVVLPLLAAGSAQAQEESPEDFQSTQSPTQGLTAVGTTLGDAEFGLMDALNGDNRPDGANGVETEFPPPESFPLYVEGPVGGLVKNGPFA